MPARPRDRRRRRLGLALLAALPLLVTACSTTGASSAAAPRASATNWKAVLEEAGGQTVNWYMYGGDTTLNHVVNGYVADRLERLGVHLNQVKVTDTADAVNTVLGEKQAGRTSGGAVDAVWVNGENFATGRQAGLWSCGWPSDLPNARYVDLDDPAVRKDFGTPVDDCEAVWQQASSALVYDSAALDPSDVASIDSLFAWAHRHPGRFTYPAPPDFTGSMLLRTVLYDTVADPSALAGPFDPKAYAVAPELWRRLRGVAPDLWRGGATYPHSQAQVEQLYGNGEIDAFFTYGPGAVAEQVRKGVYPASTREAVPAVGNIANNSFIAIPANAAHHAAALVLADVLEDPATQLELYRAEGIYPAIDLSTLPVAVRHRFAAVETGPSVLPLEELTRHTLPELDPQWVTRLERDWRTEVAAR